MTLSGAPRLESQLDELVTCSLWDGGAECDRSDLVILHDRRQAVAAEQNGVAVEQANLVHVGNYLFAVAAERPRQYVAETGHVLG